MQHHKTQARQLKAALAGYGHTLKLGHSLEVLALMHNLPNWDTLSATQNAVLLPPPADEQALGRGLERYGLTLSSEQLSGVAQLLRSLPDTPQIGAQWQETPLYRRLKRALDGGSQVVLIGSQEPHQQLAQRLLAESVPFQPFGTLPDGQFVQINPFEAGPQASVFRELELFLRLLLGEHARTPEERGVLQTALRLYVESRSQGGEFLGGQLQGFTDFMYTNQTLQEVSTRHAQVEYGALGYTLRQQALILSLYCSGAWGRMFSGETTVTLASPVTLLDCAPLSAQAEPGLTALAILAAFRQARTQGGRLVCVYEDSPALKGLPDFFGREDLELIADVPSVGVK